MIIGTDQSEYYKVIGVEREWCNVENPLIQFYFFLESNMFSDWKLGQKLSMKKKFHENTLLFQCLETLQLKNLKHALKKQVHPQTWSMKKRNFTP